ncbi:hypothetical protein [Ruegeria halocynthiae]|uniref:hypothetical protein n=1 Tax=Ruegeria halocynthiae TaxID=985054 RepID=UPI00055BD0F6|nr:hypothetical protein [Ruegeria halocynthiae]
MTRIDLRTEAWLSDIGLYCGGNTYDPVKLRQITTEKSEWSERLKRNFRHVLISRQLSVLDYEEKVDIEFGSDDELYAYLQRLYAYLFQDGPFPEWS